MKPTLKLVEAEQPSELETAWQVFAALSHFRRDNKLARDNPAFTREVNAAHDRWAALFVEAEKK